MNICCEEYFKLSQDEYLEIKKFIDNNIDIIESTLNPQKMLQPLLLLMLLLS